MGTLGELEFPQPWTGLQGHTGGKGKSCEGPGPSLASSFFKVNKRLLFILKALMCVDGGTPSSPPQSTGLCVAHSPRRYILGNKANGNEQRTSGYSSSSVSVFVTRPAFCELCPCTVDYACFHGQESWAFMLAGPSLQQRSRPQTWPYVEMTCNLMVSNLYTTREMALADFIQLQTAANVDKKETTLLTVESTWSLGWPPSQQRLERNSFLSGAIMLQKGPNSTGVCEENRAG